MTIKQEQIVLIAVFCLVVLIAMATPFFLYILGVESRITKLEASDQNTKSKMTLYEKRHSADTKELHQIIRDHKQTHLDRAER